MMNGQKIEAIIWDIGNVLLTLDFPRAHNYFIKISGVSREEYFSIPVLRKESVEAFERGEIPERAFFESFSHQLKLDITLNRFKNIFNDIFQVNRQNVKILRSCLEMGLVSAALSNTNSIHLEHIMNKYDFISELHEVFASFRLGYIKPSLEIYQHALKKLNLSAEKALFVDDRIENIQAAKKLGLKTFQYLNNDQEFRLKLKKLCPHLAI